MDDITKRLDDVADQVEAKGLFKEAADIDTVSNTIDSAEFSSITKADPTWLANKVGYHKIDETGKITEIGEERFRAKMPPDDIREAFVRGPDGYWYLQDQGYDVFEAPDKGLSIRSIKKGGRYPAPGLEIVRPK